MRSWPTYHDGRRLESALPTLSRLGMLLPQRRGTARQMSRRLVGPATRAVNEAFAEVRASFDRFCVSAQIEAPRHEDGGGCHGRQRAAPRSRCGATGHRLGRTRRRIGFSSDKIEFERRGSERGRREVTIPSQETPDRLGGWAMNLMPTNLTTRRSSTALSGCAVMTCRLRRNWEFRSRRGFVVLSVAPRRRRLLVSRLEPLS